jgi:hypothetical protein
MGGPGFQCRGDGFRPESIQLFSRADVADTQIVVG